MSDQWPEGTDSPRPAVTAGPWVSEGTGPEEAGCPRTQSSEHQPLRSGTRPDSKGDNIQGFLSDLQTLMYLQRNTVDVNKLFQVCSMDFNSENNMILPCRLSCLVSL